SAPAYRVISCNTPRLPSPLLFPYTTLFRSALVHAVAVTVTVASAGIAVAVAVAVTGLAVAVASAGIAVAVTRAALLGWLAVAGRDRKSTRLNSSHVKISYAVFCLKKKKQIQ